MRSGKCVDPRLGSRRHPRDRRRTTRTRLWPESAREPCHPARSSAPTPACSPSPARRRSPSPAGWPGCPCPILGLGAVLLVEGETGSYGLAGAVAGHARPGDARWPARSGPAPWTGAGRASSCAVAFTGYLVFGVAFVAAVVLGAPQWSWFLLAGLTGACGPNVGSIVRARWADALDAERRQTAFAFESVVDEVVFVVGPPLVTLLATLINPPVGFLTGVADRLLRRHVAVPAAGHRAAGAAPRRPTAAGGRSAVLTPTVLLVGVVYLAVGAVFGAMDVVVVAYAEEEGAPALAGLALAVYAGGSLVAGLVYGVVRLPGTPGRPVRRLRGLLRRWPPSCCSPSTRWSASSPSASSPGWPSRRSWCRGCRWSSRGCRARRSPRRSPGWSPA